MLWRAKLWSAAQGKLATAALVPIRQPGGGGNRAYWAGSMTGIYVYICV